MWGSSDIKSAGKARNNGLYRHIRTSKEIIRNLLNDSNNNFVFLLQIWNKNNDEEVILEELFANKEAANIHLKKYSDENDMSQKSYQIEKYVVNQKYWIDGYITC